MGLFSGLIKRLSGTKEPPRAKGYRGRGGSRGRGGLAEGDPGDALTPDDIEDFVYGNQLLFVQSSNVAAAQYHLDERQLMVEYLNGDAWMYQPVTEEMAIEFARAPSKGNWVWDNLKVRGTKTKHQVGAVKIR